MLFYGAKTFLKVIISFSTVFNYSFITFNGELCHPAKITIDVGLLSKRALSIQKCSKIVNKLTIVKEESMF